MSREGASYFITFTDDFSHYGYVYLMKHKNDVFETFKVFQNEGENQLGKKIKAIRSDRGGEDLSHDFVNHMKSCGIVSQLTPPYTPQHNMGYALKSVAHILNMVPTKKVDMMPYEIWHSKAPKLSYLRETKRKQWVTTSTIHSRIRFLLLEMRSSLRIVSHYKKRVGVTDYSKRVAVTSERMSQAPDIYGFYVDVEEHKLGDLNEPLNYKVALSDSESNKWLDAMNTEMQSMKGNQVSSLVDHPPNGRTVGSKWLFKRKTNMDDNIDIKTAFLNGHLNEDVYMVQPEGFVDPKHPSKVCKLQRSIYGLKQASRSWNKRFDEEIKKIGFTQNPDEPCVYLKASGSKMENSKHGSTPMQEKPDYRKSQGAQTPSKQNLGDIHWTAVKAILKTDKDDTKSQSGYVFMLNGEAVDWKRAKQSTIAMSSTKDEYIDAAKASMEAVWMRKFINGLGDVMPSNKRPTKMLCDNTPAIEIANDPRIMRGARHDQWKYHYIHEVIQAGEIVHKKVHIDDNLADPFTKPMPYIKHFKHVMGIGVCPASSLI
ncbi:retrotransposon protein, putative, ty1-copia subclass [Tanacetum coccineum]